MLSMQQLIKVFRQLQSGNNNGGELIRQSLKCVAAATTTSNTTTTSAAVVDSSLSELDISTTNRSTRATTTTTAANIPQEGTIHSSQEVFMATTTANSDIKCGENTYGSSNNSNEMNNTPQPLSSSIISLLHEYGSAVSTVSALANETETSKDFAANTNSEADSATVDSVAIAKATNTSVSNLYTSAATATAPPPHLCRSQQIQNFYQQQLHHFHTQHNQSLYAKQKQTHFAMSSLAAEPIALKQDEFVAKGNGGSKGSVGSCCDSVHASDHDNTKQNSAAAASKPCFNTGLAEILQFMELIGNLKHTKRTGWVLRDVSDCESISGHMYRMSMMTFLLDGSEGLNQIRCMELALVHDLAESLVGDITPFCGVSKEEKRNMEFKAMADICKLIEPRGKRIMELFEEYEDGKSAESRFVKDLDRLDMVMQAFEYEKRDDCLLRHQEFFDSTEGKFKHPFVKKLVDEIYEQRKNLAKAKGATPPPKIEVPNMEDTNGHCAEEADQQKSSSSSTS